MRLLGLIENWGTHEYDKRGAETKKRNVVSGELEGVGFFGSEFASWVKRLKRREGVTLLFNPCRGKEGQTVIA